MTEKIPSSKSSSGRSVRILALLGSNLAFAFLSYFSYIGSVAATDRAIFAVQVIATALATSTSILLLSKLGDALGNVETMMVTSKLNLAPASNRILFRSFSPRKAMEWCLRLVNEMKFEAIGGILFVVFYQYITSQLGIPLVYWPRSPFISIYFLYAEFLLGMLFWDVTAATFYISNAGLVLSESAHFEVFHPDGHAGFGKVGSLAVINAATFGFVAGPLVWVIIILPQYFSAYVQQLNTAIFFLVTVVVFFVPILFIRSGMATAKDRKMKELEGELSNTVRKFVTNPGSLSQVELSRLSVFLQLQDQIARDSSWPLNITLVTQAFVVAILPLILEYIATGVLHLKG